MKQQIPIGSVKSFVTLHGAVAHKRITFSHGFVTATATVFTSFGLLSSCGESNPYKEKEKRCKLNCEGQDAIGKRGVETIPRKDPALSLALNYWDANTTRTPFELPTQINIASNSPFDIAYNSLHAMGENAKVSREMIGSKEPWKACIAAQFVNAPKPLGQGLEWAADFGKCQTLADFDTAAESVRKKDLAKGVQSATTLYQGFEQSFRFAILNPTSLSQTSLNLVESTQQTSLLDQSILFAPTSAKDFACSETDCESLAFNFASGESKKIKLTNKGMKDENRIIAKWTAGGFSSDPEKALRAQFTEKGQSLVLNGSIYSALAVTTNPAPGQMFKGEKSEGYTLEYQFLDFKIKNAGPRLSTTLGMDRTTLLSGVYYIFLNQPLDPSLPNNKTGAAIFAAVGRGEPCLVNLFQVKGPESVEPLKVLDLCKNLP